MQFAGIDIGDQPCDGIPECHRAVQVGQRLRSNGNFAAFPAADPAEFHGFIWISVKEAESAFGNLRSAGASGGFD